MFEYTPNLPLSIRYDAKCQDNPDKIVFLWDEWGRWWCFDPYAPTVAASTGIALLRYICPGITTHRECVAFPNEQKPRVVLAVPGAVWCGTPLLEISPDGRSPEDNC